MTGRPDRTEAADPFGTAAIRDRVLRIWAASPERLREDANSEDDLVHGGYRNRLVVELAQNAADAAAASGRPGRLLLRLEENRLLAANTGAPLDAAGVLGLSTLRASAKRDDGEATGRFGVGFAAVLAITDTPAVAGRDAAVRFDRQDTLDRVRALAAHHPALAAELNRRQDRVPALRLPFPGSGSASVDVPQGYDTVVVLPLRDARAHELADTLLGEVDDALLLALPALAEVVIERDGHAARRLADVHDRWLVHSHRGRHLDIDLEHLPVEDRERSLFEVTWAVPLGRRGLGEGASQDWAAVVHAPTPTDEPLPWPVMLLARLPVEPDRRTVHPGPVADAVIAAAAAPSPSSPRTWSSEASTPAGRSAGRSVLDLLPSASAALPAGWFDASLREAVLARLRSARVLPRADGRGAVRPRDAVVLEGPGADHAGLVAALGARFESLVDVPAVHGPLLRMLDVARAEPADLVEQWPGPAGPDADDAWRQWLASLAPAAGDPAAREALAALAVPVITEEGGLRAVRGARGRCSRRPGARDEPVLLDDVAHDDPVAEVPGPDGRHLGPDHRRPARYGAATTPRSRPAIAELLHRLGAQRADAPSLLAHPAVVAAVRASVDDPDAVDLTEAVLTLVQQCLDAGHDVGGLPWLTELAVPDTEGDLVPAGLLLQPGSPMAQLVDTDAAGLAGQDLVHRWRSDVLHAVGVAARPVLVCAEEVDLRELGASGELPGLPGELDGMADWAEELAHSASRAGRIQELLAARIDGELVAVRDLDLVRQDALAGLVDLLLADPAARRALVDPVGVLVEGTRGEAVTSWRGRRPSYTAWWLRSEIGWPDGGARDRPGARRASAPGTALAGPSRHRGHSRARCGHRLVRPGRRRLAAGAGPSGRSGRRCDRDARPEHPAPGLVGAGRGRPGQRRRPGRGVGGHRDALGAGRDTAARPRRGPGRRGRPALAATHRPGPVRGRHRGHGGAAGRPAGSRARLPAQPRTRQPGRHAGRRALLDRGDLAGAGTALGGARRPARRRGRVSTGGWRTRRRPAPPTLLSCTLRPPTVWPGGWPGPVRAGRRGTRSARCSPRTLR